MLRSENLTNHAKADRFILLFIEKGDKVKPGIVKQDELNKIQNRLMEIAEKIQCHEILGALMLAGGMQFYFRVKLTFEQIEAYFERQGLGFGKIWDQRATHQLLKKELKRVLDTRHERSKTEDQGAVGPDLLD